MFTTHKFKHKLLVVDIQKEYAEFYNLHYLLKVKKFLNTHVFEDISMLIDIFEENYAGESIPSFIDRRLTREPIFKQYSSDLPMRLLKKEGLNVIATKQKLLENNHIMPLQGGLLVLLEPRYIPDYKFCDSDMLEFDYLEYIPPVFKDYLDSCQGSKVHLIGGGFCECVNTTKKILDLLDIPNCIHSNYCYEMNPFSALSYSPLESKLEKFADQSSEIINKQTRKIDWAFKTNKDFFF